MNLDLEHMQILKQSKSKDEIFQLCAQSRKLCYFDSMKNGSRINEQAVFTLLQTCHIS